MRKIFWFIFKWTSITVLVFCLWVGFVVAKSVWTWEQPCPRLHTAGASTCEEGR